MMYWALEAKFVSQLNYLEMFWEVVTAMSV